MSVSNLIEYLEGLCVILDDVLGAYREQRGTYRCENSNIFLIP